MTLGRRKSPDSIHIPTLRTQRSGARYNKCSTRSISINPPVADVTERRYGLQKRLGSVDTCMTILQFRLALYCRIKSSRPSLKGWAVWMCGFFGKFGIRRNKENDCSIRKRNAGLVCLLSLPGAESNHFWKRMLQLLRNVQGSESQIMSETNHAPSIPVFRLEMMQLDGRG